MSVPRLDVYIPAHAKDFEILPDCVASVRAHIPGCGAVHVVSARPHSSVEAIWHQEDAIVSLADVERALPPNDATARWYRQQLLKLLCPLRVPRWLQVDADIVFQREAAMVDTRGVSLLSPYRETAWHQPYFDWMARLLPGLEPTGTQSLIAHHLVYDRDILDSLLAEVEDAHRMPFAQAYCEAVDPAWVSRSGAAESELYSHYALSRYPSRVRVRSLRWEECETRQLRPDLDFTGHHTWNRRHL